MKTTEQKQAEREDVFYRYGGAAMIFLFFAAVAFA